MVLPPTPETRAKIGGNFVTQRLFGGATTRATISSSQYPGHDLVTTDLAPPYKEILIRQAKARRIETSFGVTQPADYPEGSKTLALEWETLGEIGIYANTPDKVLQGWTNNVFAVEDEIRDLPGLRPPQIGALHEISAAHFAVGKQFEAATVVLPTGTGKTETMLAMHVYRRPAKLLVLVPSNPLRHQSGGSSRRWAYTTRRRCTHRDRPTVRRLCDHWSSQRGRSKAIAGRVERAGRDSGHPQRL